MRFNEEISGKRYDVILAGAAVEWILKVTNAAGVKNVDVAKGASVAGGIGEQITLNVIDNCRMPPGQKLCLSKQLFAATGAPDYRQVTKLSMVLISLDAKWSTILTNAKK